MIAGEERKIDFFAMDLPHSDACLVQAYPAERSEAFCEGHNVGFEFFGGVPRSILYDNTQAGGGAHPALRPATQRTRSPVAGRRVMSDTPEVLLAHHLKALRLRPSLREYDKLAR